MSNLKSQIRVSGGNDLPLWAVNPLQKVANDFANELDTWQISAQSKNLQDAGMEIWISHGTLDLVYHENKHRREYRIDLPAGAILADVSQTIRNTSWCVALLALTILEGSMSFAESSKLIDLAKDGFIDAVSLEVDQKLWLPNGDADEIPF